MSVTLNTFRERLGQPDINEFQLFSLFKRILVLTGEVPRRTRGSLIGMVNDREFGVSYLEANITDNDDEGSSTVQAHLDNIPPTVGE